MSSAAHFVYIADVYCPWCYGFAPVMQKVAAEHPAFPVHVLGGNLISQPMTLAEDVARQPGLVDFWREVEQATGRSLAGAIRAAENGEQMRLYSPGADELLAVLRQLAPGHELEQLCMLEDMTYGEGKDLFAEGSLAEIAARWNIPASRFESALDQSASQAATERSLEMASRLMGEITSYPSVLLVQANKVDAVSRGYVHYETVAARLEDAMRDLGLSVQASSMCSHQHGCTSGRQDQPGSRKA